MPRRWKLMRGTALISTRAPPSITSSTRARSPLYSPLVMRTQPPFCRREILDLIAIAEGMSAGCTMEMDPARQAKTSGIPDTAAATYASRWASTKMMPLEVVKAEVMARIFPSLAEAMNLLHSATMISRSRFSRTRIMNRRGSLGVGRSVCRSTPEALPVPSPSTTSSFPCSKYRVCLARACRSLTISWSVGLLAFRRRVSSASRRMASMRCCCVRRSCSVVRGRSFPASSSSSSAASSKK
mmetsp:Transcript_6848/g.28029  ORF Transcript_6848/g.28029 Transcript_6848/m.28029 type:complete len:241 (+) Transcript_6848:179-901(+)